MSAEYTDFQQGVPDGRSVLRCYALSSDKYSSEYWRIILLLSSDSQRERESQILHISEALNFHCVPRYTHFLYAHGSSVSYNY
jgi:hypothetical protein